MDKSLLRQTEFLDAVKAWLEKAVIGLNLCPFAKSVIVRDRVRFTLSQADNLEALTADLKTELAHLHSTDPASLDTTLLIHPYVLQDFEAYNDYLGVADAVLEQMDLVGELQIASFHPGYRFAGTGEDDITNYTNRSPFPILHLLRESSVEATVAAYPDPDSIYRNNMDLLTKLGKRGWDALGIPYFPADQAPGTPEQ